MTAPSGLMNTDPGGVPRCLVCSEAQRTVLFKPCNHMAACAKCGGRTKKCPLCKQGVEDQVMVETCSICTKAKADVLFSPCGHMVACDGKSIATCTSDL